MGDRVFRELAAVGRARPRRWRGWWGAGLGRRMGRRSCRWRSSRLSPAERRPGKLARLSGRGRRPGPRSQHRARPSGDAAAACRCHRARDHCRQSATPVWWPGPHRLAWVHQRRVPPLQIGRSAVRPRPRPPAFPQVRLLSLPYWLCLLAASRVERWRPDAPAFCRPLSRRIATREILEAVGAVATSSPERFESLALGVRRALGRWQSPAG